jgi:hypothetical protein
MKRTAPAKLHRKKLDDKKRSSKPIKNLPILERYSEHTTFIKADNGAQVAVSIWNNQVRIYESGKRPRAASEKERKRYLATLKKERD